MSKHNAARAAADPRNVSPKVKAVGWAGGALTAAALVVAAFLIAVPADAFTPLGVWAVPTTAAVTTLAGLLAAYAKSDPAREPNLLQGVDGGYYSDLSDLAGEGEPELVGEFDSNRVDAVQDRPEVVAADGEPAALSELEDQLREQDERNKLEG